MPEHSEEYKKGYAAAWDDAVQAVWSNRNHHRAMSGYAPETQEEAMKRIYSKWPADPPPVLAGKEHLIGGSPIVQSTIDIMLDSIDLYVVLPPGSFEVR